MEKEETMNLKSKFLHLFLLLLTITILFSCGSGKKEEIKTSPPPPPQVTVEKPLIQDVTEYVYYTGNLKASKYVEIKSKVQGILEKINFQPGSIVKKGDILFIIDQKPYKAKLNQAIAELNVMKAELNLAKSKLKRKEVAFKSRAISEVELLQARANVDVYKANVKKAEAAVNAAQLNLNDTVIRAPFSGRIGRNLIDIGNLVTPGNMLLTTIVKDDPIYAYVYMNERDFLYFKKHMDFDCKCDNISVNIKLAGSDNYSFSGHLDFMGNKLDPNTGTIELRGVFPNKNHMIYPGLFTKMRIPVALRKNALLVREKAIGIDQRGEYIFTVNGENIVEYRHIETGPVVNGYKLVYKGIKKDEMVIVNGILRAKPGSKVSPMTPEEEKAMIDATKQSPKN
jgi:RND family efflux transporter MFP subunit